MHTGSITRVGRVLAVLAGLASRPGMGVMEVLAGLSPRAKLLASRGLRLNSPRYHGGGRPERTVHSLHKSVERSIRYDDSGYPGSVRRRMIREGKLLPTAFDRGRAELQAVA